ncbi:MAG TPA: threonine synthase [Planctomycetes bacterium]|nr:threonine synthase [Planctomycetota bacterium]
MKLESIHSTLSCLRCDAPERAASCETCAELGPALEWLPDLERLDGAELAETFRQRRLAKQGPDRSGVWRYRELIAPGLPLEAMVTRFEGNTGLYPVAGVARWAGLTSGELRLKHEGENPTASFKDRGMCVGISLAIAEGAKIVACASTGNTSASLASYAALAGVPGVVFVPAGKISSGKMAQTIAYGARVLEVEGSFDLAMQLVEEASARFGLGLLNSVNPWRIEGQKSIGLEILDDLDWEAPDWIVLPSGNLGNVSALGKALREAHAIGLIDRLPRVACVQADGAAPFARWIQGHRAGTADTFLAEPEPETIATAIRIGNPRSWEKATRELDHLQGVCLSVSDSEILAAKEQIDASGVGCEPASAASVAGLKRLVAEGTIAPDARVVGILTGHLLKDPVTTAQFHDGQLKDARPTRTTRQTVDADLDAIGAALADLLQ